MRLMRTLASPYESLPKHLTFLSLLILSGCSGGPSSQELCGAIIGALVPVYVVTTAVLTLLEAVRRAPDRNTATLGKEAGISTAILVVAALLSFLLGAAPDDNGSVIIALLAYGALALGVSLILWRVRRGAPYASRILRSAQVGTALGLPALLLWHPSLWSIADTYIMVLTMASLMGAIYVTPILVLGLLIESVVRRAPAS